MLPARPGARRRHSGRCHVVLIGGLAARSRLRPSAGSPCLRSSPCACGFPATASAAVSPLHHVVLIVGENTYYQQITPAHAPYLTGTIKPQAASMTNYHSFIRSSSLGEYIAIVSSQFTKSEANNDTPDVCHQTVPSLFQRRSPAAGRPAAAGCDRRTRETGGTFPKRPIQRQKPCRCRASSYRHGDSNSEAKPVWRRISLARAVSATAVNRAQPLFSGADFPPTFPQRIEVATYRLGPNGTTQALSGAGRASESGVRVGRVFGTRLHAEAGVAPRAGGNCAARDHSGATLAATQPFD